jgi:hypothetical protein
MGGLNLDWSKVLDVLRGVPVWIAITAVAVTGSLILWLPAVSWLDLGAARKWPWLAPVTLLAIVALVAQLVAVLAKSTRDAWMKSRHRWLVFTVNPQMNTTFWGHHTQPDGSTNTSLHIRAHVLNTGDAAARLVAVRLIRPKLPPEALFPPVWTVSNPGGGHGTHSAQHPILAKHVADVSFTLTAKKPIGRDGKFLPIVIGVTDHTGNEHRLKVKLWYVGP